MEFDVWLALVGLFLAGGLTPGPAVMLVVAASLQHGFRLSLLPAIGVSTANLVWIALAAGGAAALALAFPAGFTALKIAGCLFILWIAISLVRKPPTRLAGRDAKPPKRAALFAKGIGLQLSNPNALVYFGALLPSYFDTSAPLLPQVAIAVATITVLEMFGLSVYAGLADRLAARFANPVFARTFAIIAASVMVISAVYAAWATR